MEISSSKLKEMMNVENDDLDVEKEEDEKEELSDDV